MHVLVVEDEERLARAIALGLTEHGLSASTAHDGQDGYRRATRGDVDLIVLDLMLPGMSGEDLCRRLRAEAVWTPILVLTAKDDEDDEVGVLDLGADDFLRKPFSSAVLLARVHALLRRGPAPVPVELAVGNLVLDVTRRRARRGPVPIELTRREFALLEALARRAGTTVAKEDLLDEVWGSAGDRNPNVVEVYVGYLRRKIDAPFGRRTLGTVRGLGYRLDDLG